MMQASVLNFLNRLHRGGEWAYYCTFKDPQSPNHGFSLWFPAGKPELCKIPEDWQDVYFGIHPTRTQGSTMQRSKKIGDRAVCAINCLYAEFDAKDFNNSMQAALTQAVESSRRPPSVLINSGGGFHAYWLLSDTCFLDNQDACANADRLQKAWVERVGSDKGARDLTRVLRVPGTLNYKYVPPRSVEFVWCDLDLTYPLDVLEKFCLLGSSEASIQQAIEPAAVGRSNNDLRPGDEFARRTSWDAILEPHGWKKLRSLGAVTHWQRPGKDGDGLSATTGHEGHDVLYVFSSNAQPFESQKGYTKFTAWAMLNHDGDFSEAVKALVNSDYQELVGAVGGKKGRKAPLPLKPESDQAGATWEDISRFLGPIQWAWQPWLPMGMITILAAESGAGKSALALALAGCFLRGDPWPDKKTYNGTTLDVLWCEAEAGQALNLERAANWGLPRNRIRTPFNNPMEDFDLGKPDHLNALFARAMDTHIGFIVIDSLSGANTGSKEKDSEIIQIIKPLATIARDTGKPILLTHHLRKRGMFDSLDKIDLERLRGSSAIVQTARVVWALDHPDPQAKEWKRLSIIKSNLSKFPQPIGITITEGGVRFGLAPEPPRVESTIDKAANLLLSILQVMPVSATDVQNEVEKAGISWGSALRAKNKLGIDSLKKDGKWYWTLPEVGSRNND